MDATGKFKGAPEPQRDIFLYRVDKECDVEDIKLMLRGNNCEPKEIKIMSKEEAKYRSFKLTVGVSSANTLLDDSFPWPHGVRVRRFFRKREDDKDSKGAKKD